MRLPSYPLEVELLFPRHCKSLVYTFHEQLENQVISSAPFLVLVPHSSTRYLCLRPVAGDKHAHKHSHTNKNQNLHFRSSFAVPPFDWLQAQGSQRHLT